MESSFFFIVNARIGESKIARLKLAIATYLQHSKTELKITEFGGHATRLAQEALQQSFDVIVAVGGDGTVNEVIQIVAKSKAKLAIVPTGSGNGLARHCGIPLQIERAVKLLANGKKMTIDLGKANDIYFISNAGVGFDAWVCNTIKQTKSRGLKMYVQKVIQNYFSYNSDTYTIETDGNTWVQKAFFLNVANGKEFGYGFEIAPEATLQDGMLDLILVKSINAFNGFKFVWDGWFKKLIRNKNCIYIRAKKIVLKGSALSYFQTDGDAHDCAGICTIEVQQNALQLLVPNHINNL